MKATTKTLKARTYTSPLIQEILGDLTDVEKAQSRTRLTLAARIDDYRKAKGLTKSGLAEKLNRNPSEITKWLSGTHNFTNDTLVEIAFALQVEVRDFYEHYTEEKKAQTEMCMRSFELNPIVVLLTPPSDENADRSYFAKMINEIISTTNTPYVA